MMVFISKKRQVESKTGGILNLVMKNDHIPKTTLSCDPTEKKQPQKCQKPTVSSKITQK